MAANPLQFHISTLLLITTAAAIGLAAIRLPFPPIAKFLIVQSIAVCLYGLLVQKGGWASPRVGAVIPMLMLAIVIGRAFWHFDHLNKSAFTVAGFLYWSALLANVVILLALVAFVFRRTPSRTP